MFINTSEGTHIRVIKLNKNKTHLRLSFCLLLYYDYYIFVFRDGTKEG